ncbi:RHS repeat domain-containing protein [Verrucomicrobiota bacterium]
MTGADYSDSTPDNTFTYDRMGRQKTASSSVSAHTFAYNGLLLDTETIARVGITNVIDRSYDGLGRSSGFDLDSDYSVAYGHDSYGRFSSVSSSVDSVVNYSYLANSDLISTLTSDLGLLTSRSYEPHRNLLTQVKNQVDSTLISQYDYINDNGGRRTSVKHSGSAFETGPAFNKYGYNSRSEVIAGDRYWGTDVGDTSDPVGLQSSAYSYDNIGNRTSTTNNGQAATYTANALNQYSQRTIPAVINILGSAETNATVTINNSAVNRQQEYWYKQLTATNSAEAAYSLITVMGVYNPPDTNDPDVVTVESGKVFVAKTPEQFTYDDDGNLLSDGRWVYTWNAENRLIQMETSTNLCASVPVVLCHFSYDYMGRRAGKTVYNWDSGTTNWVEESDTTFLYDNWNMIQGLESTDSGVQTNLYTWGLDISGSLQGAGGIGGLIAATLGTNTVCYTFDANGNVSELLDADTGSVFAHYEYNPFGETIVATGPMAEENPYRFSTKYTDDESGLLYYGYRYYSPSLGRWPSRDPIGEKGGMNLYMFVYNSPMTFVDSVGLRVGQNVFCGYHKRGQKEWSQPSKGWWTSTCYRDVSEVSIGSEEIASVWGLIRNAPPGWPSVISVSIHDIRGSFSANKIRYVTLKRKEFVCACKTSGLFSGQYRWSRTGRKQCKYEQEGEATQKVWAKHGLGAKIEGSIPYTDIEFEWPEEVAEWGPEVGRVIGEAEYKRREILRETCPDFGVWFLVP